MLHLGNGASMCAIQAGRSLASTMGFTAVEGLPMGTRSGSLDPGVILYLMDQRGMDTRQSKNSSTTQSGLLGVSGISSDMRTLLASEDPRAKLAVDLFLYRIRRETRLSGGRTWRTGCNRFYGRHRRKRPGHSQPCLPRCRLAGC